MIKKCTLLLFALCSLLLGANAQHLCGTDLIQAQRLANEPGFAQATQQYDANWAALMQNGGNNALIVNTPLGPVYEIPLVIHVIHTGGAVGSNYNPSAATLSGMVDYLNKTYAATWPAYKDTNSYGTRFPIQFTLAKRDPQCNATTGIDRMAYTNATYVQYGVAVNSSNGVTDAQIKSLVDWPNTEYYNIWVVNKIDGWDGYSSGSGVVGYAMLPPANAATDGTIMMAAFSIAGESTLPHEIGHAFSLYHTFQGGSTTACPPNTSCATQNDLICDTDPQKQTFSCDTTQINTCTGTVYGHQLLNHMGYSSCTNHFTPGQRTRWLNGLTTYRLSLVSSLGSVAPDAGPTAASCIPTISQPTNTLNSGISKVVFNDMTGQTAGGYNSDGNLVYIDRTCFQRANVVAGQTYPISVTTTSQAHKVRVYLDYNNDGIFAATELVYTHDGTTSNETHTGNIQIPTNATTCTPIRMRVVADRSSATTPPSACGVLTYGQAEDYAVIIKGVSNSATLSIALTTGTNPSCINTPLTFTATTTGTPTAPTYKWYVNGVFTGTTATTYSSSTLANGAVVTAKLFYAGPCSADSSVSNAITIVRQTNVAPTVSIVITNGSNPGCPGQPVTFTATPTNGGTAPAYQWKVNGVIQSGATTNTFTTSTLTNGNIVTAVLISNLPCASPTTANSNAITYTTGNAVATAFISITGGSNPTCTGKPVTFSAAVTNAGTTPTYQWLLNGSVVPGVTGTTFTTSSLNNLDSVQFLMISSNPCIIPPTVFSNVIRMTVLPNDTVKVNTAITRGSNPGCKDSVLQFTATGVNTSTNVAYAWFVNGVQVAAGAVYTTSTLNNNDVVYARLITTGAGCRLSDTAFSTPVTLSISVTPAPPTISFIGTMLVSDSSNIQWYGPNGIITGATSQSYHPTVAGDYYAVALNNGCTSGKSNILKLSLLSVSQYNLSNVNIFPNPTTGQLVIDWGSNASTARITVYTPSGQAVLHEIAQNAFRKTLDLSTLANGVYFVVLQDESGKAGTVRIVVAK